MEFAKLSAKCLLLGLQRCNNRKLLHFKRERSTFQSHYVLFCLILHRIFNQFLLSFYDVCPILFFQRSSTKFQKNTKSQGSTFEKIVSPSETLANVSFLVVGLMCFNLYCHVDSLQKRIC